MAPKPGQTKCMYCHEYLYVEQKRGATRSAQYHTLCHELAQLRKQNGWTHEEAKDWQVRRSRTRGQFKNMRDPCTGQKFQKIYRILTEEEVEEIKKDRRNNNENTGIR